MTKFKKIVKKVKNNNSSLQKSIKKILFKVILMS